MADGINAHARCPACIPALRPCQDAARERILDYKTSMIKDEDPLRGLLVY